ncbi:MAG: class I poly(R)-hydroxyalkanoic acid synthase [Betaproteobacteria bacterium]|nr:class I poly(R)-hydroxyalkanoic acid synthase [Betaproteobacteria bacterium]PWB60545.1 MAG: class I poly(R)-hydroxyalkanoic acid synthase [Betaproteobacteria bacterium]
MAGFSEAYRAWLESVSAKPQTLLDLQGKYMQEQMNLWMRAFQPEPEGEAKPAADKRFTAPEWSELPLFRYYRDSYLLTSKMMMQAVEEADMDAATKRRMRFFMRQYLDAAAPSNYLATNPEAIKAALESGGKTIEEGVKNLLGDMEKGRISMTDEAAFEVGHNIAVTQGAVVFENDLIQLVQYSPLTEKVHERPLVMIPPCINKFYIMDLQPENSLVRYAIEQGHTVFMVSWRNVKPPLDKLTWDDYLEMGVMAAIDEARAITGADKVNALGFCIGGTLLASALAVLARKKRKPVASLTLMTALLEFSDVGEIRVYIDRNFVEKREKKLAKGGIVPGAELASAFSSLRANDLVWSYVVSNYLKGQQPPAFDLLYWNGDSTNLPGPMYAYYLRSTYQDNKLVVPDALTMCGVPVDLKRVDVPAFVFAAREDHIVPWKGAYESARYLGGSVKFVLGASGHIAGSINSASKGKRNYWTNERLGPDPDKWFAQAQEAPGSWWVPWAKWLVPYAGKTVPARRKLGDAKHPAIEPAPGRYVKERAEVEK